MCACVRAPGPYNTIRVLTSSLTRCACRFGGRRRGGRNCKVRGMTIVCHNINTQHNAEHKTRSRFVVWRGTRKNTLGAVPASVSVRAWLRDWRWFRVNMRGKRPRGCDIILIYEAAAVQTSPQTFLSERKNNRVAGSLKSSRTRFFFPFSPHTANLVNDFWWISSATCC